MSTPLRTLIVEDSETDAELLVLELMKGEYEPSYKRVHSHEAMRDALREQQWDVVISDYRMPSFDGLEALKTLQESGLDLPFILISGMIEEETAVSAMKAGAHDYITKGNLARLIPAIQRELREAAVRRERRRIEKQLQEYHDSLEKMVEERTAQWKATNDQLLLEIESHQRAEAALRESEQRFAAFMLHLPAAVWMKDLQGRYVYANTEAERIFSTPLDELAGKTDFDFFTPETARQFVENDRRVLAEGRGVQTTEVLTRADGVEHSSIVSKFALPGPDGNPAYVAGIALDITERKRAEEELKESEDRFRTLADNIAQLAWMTDETGWMFWYNKRWYDYTGTTLDEMKGRGWTKVHHPDHVQRVVEKISRCFETGQVWEDTFPLRSKEGQYRWFLSQAIPIRDEKGKIIRWFGTSTDITERRQMEEEIKHMAHHDTLTGLPNRRLFMDIVTFEITEARRNHKELAILFLDLDRFKEINDTFGHAAGDKLLVEVARRLKENIRESDVVARIGGDEFNILLSDIPRAEYVATVAQKILNAFREPYFLASYALHVTGSMGISIYPDDSEEIDTIFRYADIAMYHAKELGKNTYQFYNPDINKRSVERIKFEGYLRQTIKRGELSVHYQPQIDIRTGRIVCAEALVRWQHPVLGMLPSKRFIPAAEEMGFVTTIDEWVLRTACAQFKIWHEAGYHPVCVTVNLSAREFQKPGLVTTIAKILEETGLSPDCLELEITESMAMRDIEHTAKQLKELTSMGVRISIDDFGTGYSSLNYLKRLPIQRLKIDQSFLRDLTTDSDDRAIIQAVTAMAHNMKMKVVAEGVETEEQLRFVHESQCDEAQGYLFNKPLTPERFTELIAAGI